MKQVLVNEKTNQIKLTDVPAPQVGAMEVLVATEASLITAGTEKMMVDFTKKSLLSTSAEGPDLVAKVFNKIQTGGLAAALSNVFSKLEEPLPLGYSAAGEIIAVGEALKGQFVVGEKVAMAGEGFANHAEVNAVPKNLVAKLPSNVPVNHACFATVAATALHGVRNAKVSIGDHVLVVGLGLVGQLTSQILKASGCKVFAVDYDADRLKLAEETGADLVHALSAGGGTDLVKTFTSGKGFDAVIICASTESNDPIDLAVAWARDRATVVLAGKAGTQIPYVDFMKKELSFVISRAYGAGKNDKSFEEKGGDYPIGYVRWNERENLKEALNLISTGALKIEALLSHAFPIDEVADAYALVTSKSIPHMGVVLTYPSDASSRLKTRLNLRPTEIVTGKVGLSFIGAGEFARNVLLPAFKGATEVELLGIVSKNGVNARLAGEKFGFRYVAGSENEIINDMSTQAVVIATQNNTHANLACVALRQGKHVFVEKPLGLTFEEVDRVEEEYRNNNKTLMVGFNRRYSPYTQALVDHFEKIKSPKQVFIRVNAGALAADSWQADPHTGGGRLVGEMCHFVDLALLLSGSPVAEVYAVAGTGQDVYSITLRHDDGGVSTLVYTSEGDVNHSKEWVEVYGGGAVGVIDNFKKAWIVSEGRKQRIRLSGNIFANPEDKGHLNELATFMSAITGGVAPDVDAMFAVSRLTLLAVRSAQENKPLKVTF